MIIPSLSLSLTHTDWLLTLVHIYSGQKTPIPEDRPMHGVKVYVLIVAMYMTCNTYVSVPQPVEVCISEQSFPPLLTIYAMHPYVEWREYENIFLSLWSSSNWIRFYKTLSPATNTATTFGPYVLLSLSRSTLLSSPLTTVTIYCHLS